MRSRLVRAQSGSWAGARAAAGLWAGARAAAPALALSVLVACGGQRDLLPVPLPDVSRADPEVQRQVREKHAVLTKLIDGDPTDGTLAAAFGELGMLLHAGEFTESAEPAYRNAEALDPANPRWPYYLGRVHTARGKPAEAVAAFKRSLALDAELATLIRLGRLYLDQGQPDRAQPIFEQARTMAPQSAPVLAGLGQAALARRDFAGAVQLLEAALSAEPRAASVHAPLAQAYRGLGDTRSAEAHAARWQNTDVPVPDPWDDQLRMALGGGMAYEQRGVTALEAGRYAEAADLFRAGLAATPPASPIGRSMRHKLGLALHLAGQEAAAVREFEEAIRLAPASGSDEPAARAHYALGVIHAGHGRASAAIDHLSRAVAYDSRYVQARIVLGDALLEVGRLDEALEQHREAVASDPRSIGGRIGYARALLGLGRRAEARNWLEASVRLQPDRPELQEALAKIAPNP